ncbi:hypothetical protein CEUSTIGMA_g1571.t1 [Chlamydomonas eustigma]|uniref:Protein kinase domain-containing protein n=1 Tax=Chlamydomonas eustigma TaxID=1157962 RepID=A0A250WU03_9CHLO|nr:hypothetical protein CEUSTIGMA_g1571.t1 [Chlamydomonas eustigma]|eukprot:GAX74122.1 hypothetical protein CEUSTIGMA_g1571.t1 [Chlamydomonas eustigma]
MNHHLMLGKRSSFLQLSQVDSAYSKAWYLVSYRPFGCLLQSTDSRSGDWKHSDYSGVFQQRVRNTAVLAAPQDITSTVTADYDVCNQAVQDGYNAAENAAYWETRPVPVIARLLKIGTEFLRWQLLSSKMGSALLGSAGGAEASPALLLQALIRLGPAFVKIGQALSSRPDVLPPDFLFELEKLQDRIPAFSSQEAYKVIEKELGRPVRAVYSKISAEPVAAASLGQVYRAVLSSTGREVAVKVQRPGVVEMIAMDVFILRYLAYAARRYFKLNTDLPSLVDEWATSLFRELNYTREAANAAKFKQLFKRMPEIYVPEMIPDFTTTGVMTMEWVEGERLRTASASGRKGGNNTESAGPSKGNQEDLQLVEVGVRCSLEQMLEEGFYHADPHPGNLLKMKDGRLCYIDFGMMGTVDTKVRTTLVRATLHLVNREYSALAEDFVKLGFLPEGSDQSKIAPALMSVFQEALKGGVSNLSFGDLSADLGKTMYQFKFRVPPYYTLLVRSLTVLEGIALASDPSYKVLSAAYPWIARRLLTDRSPELRATLTSLLYKEGGRFQFSRLESLLMQASKVKALGKMRQQSRDTAAKSSSEAGSSSLKLLLSAEGDFVRDILLDEVAKGIDAAWRLTFDTAVEAVQQQAAARQFPFNLFPTFPVWSTTAQNLTLGSNPPHATSSSVSPYPMLGSSAVSNAATGSIADRSMQAMNVSSSVSPVFPSTVLTASSSSSSSFGSQSHTSSPEVTKAQVWGFSAWPTQSTPGVTASLAFWGIKQQPEDGGDSASSSQSNGLQQLLSSVPRLAESEDREQIEGLSSLAKAMYSLAESRQSHSSGSGSSATSLLPTILPENVASQVQQAASFFEWLSKEIQEVPLEERRMALSLPLQLFNKVSSRVVARAIRSSVRT